MPRPSSGYNVQIYYDVTFKARDYQTVLEKFGEKLHRAETTIYQHRKRFMLNLAQVCNVLHSHGKSVRFVKRPAISYQNGYQFVKLKELSAKLSKITGNFAESMTEQFKIQPKIFRFYCKLCWQRMIFKILHALLIFFNQKHFVNTSKLWQVLMDLSNFIFFKSMTNIDNNSQNVGF